MPIYTDNVLKIEVEENTPGGNTYYVETTDWPGNLKAVCYRRSRQDKGGKGIEPKVRCSHQAGYNTWHLGTGACHLHGGNNTGNIVDGASSNQKRNHLQIMVENYLKGDRSALLDLSSHLAATRALFDEMLLTFPNPEDVEAEEYEWATKKLLAAVEVISNLVDKISRIEARNTISAGQVVYLRATMADLLMRWVPDPNQRALAIKDLISRMPGSEVGALWYEGNEPPESNKALIQSRSGR